MILGIETSCDETAAAVVAPETGAVGASVVHSQVELHRRYGGVVPELASRDHVRRIRPIIEAALAESGTGWDGLTGVAATCGPGLASSLLIGLAAAKGIAGSLGLPLVGVNHLLGHLISIAHDPQVAPEVRAERDPIERLGPLVCLLVSGGHTMLLRAAALDHIELLGRTIDDAAGEAFDKAAKILRLGYPGGPVIDRLAAEGRPGSVALPRSFTNAATPESHRFSFSFSGLKTAVLYEVRGDPAYLEGDPEASPRVRDLCASFQQAVVSVLGEKLFAAAAACGVTTVAAAGGVTLNRGLRAYLEAGARARGLRLLLAPPRLCTDNAVMIALAGRARLLRGERDALELDVDPALGLG